MKFITAVINVSTYGAIICISNATSVVQSFGSDVHISFQETGTLPCNIELTDKLYTQSRAQCASVCVSERSCFLHFLKEIKLCLCSQSVYNSSETCIADGGVVGLIDYMHLLKESVDVDPVQYPHDCLEIYQRGQRQDGIYVIQPVGGVAVDTWCDMTNGGWTVIQRRQDGSENFLRNWTDYVEGFGNKCGEFWLGLDSTNLLTTEPSELFIEMETFGDVTPTSAYARYSTFSVGSSDAKYTLSIGGYAGDCGDSLDIHDQMQFSTVDADHDASLSNNCASTAQAAWWYNSCGKSNLNGLYLNRHQSVNGLGVVWMDCWGPVYSLKKIVMKIKRI